MSSVVSICYMDLWLRVSLMLIMTPVVCINELYTLITYFLVEIKTNVNTLSPPAMDEAIRNELPIPVYTTIKLGEGEKHYFLSGSQRAVKKP